MYSTLCNKGTHFSAHARINAYTVQYIMYTVHCMHTVHTDTYMNQQAHMHGVVLTLWDGTAYCTVTAAQTNL